MHLNNIQKNKEYLIKKINTNELIKRRLYDIGIINDGKIDKMRLDKYYFFKENGRYVREEKYLLKNRF